MATDDGQRLMRAAWYERAGPPHEVLTVGKSQRLGVDPGARRVGGTVFPVRSRGQYNISILAGCPQLLPRGKHQLLISAA